MILASVSPSERLEPKAAAPIAAADARERFLRLVDRELDRSYRLAGLILGSGPEAGDAVGDAVEKAWRSLPELRSPERFQAWFDRILVNACRDRVRRRAKVRFVSISDDDEHPIEDPFATVLETDAAFRLIGILAPAEREIVLLHFWADLPLEGVADRLGIPVGTVKSRLHRALGRLRAEVAR